MVAKGRLVPVPRDDERATLFLERATDTIADLPHLRLPQNQYNLVYDAAHAVGEAILARHGYRTANGPGQHAALAEPARHLHSPPADGRPSTWSACVEPETSFTTKLAQRRVLLRRRKLSVPRWPHLA